MEEGLRNKVFYSSNEKIWWIIDQLRRLMARNQSPLPKVAEKVKDKI